MNEFETAVVNEPTVFEPLKFYCIGMRLNECENELEISLSLAVSFIFCMQFTQQVHVTSGIVESHKSRLYLAMIDILDSFQRLG